MRTEQDYHLEEETTVWIRFREPHDPDYLNPVYSDERPSTKEKVVSFAVICVVVGVVIFFCLPLLGVGW